MPTPLPKFPAKQGTRVFSGARAFFMWNGEVIGFASGVSGSEEIMYEPVDTLEHLETREHVPVGYRVTFSAQVFRTIGKGAISNNKDAPGSLKQMEIFPKFTEILRVMGVTAVIQDTISGKSIFMLHECKAASYNFNVTARGLVMQNVQFVAQKALDESEISV